MPNLFAACRIDGQLIAKRVRLDATVQQALETIFDNQEIAFREGVTTEVAFNGSWTPDEDEFLTIDVPAEAAMFEATIRGNAMAVPDIDTTHFADEGIKALFIGKVVAGSAIILVQRFTSQQLLSKRFSLFQQGNAFRQLTDPAFTLDSNLACIIENGTIKFKSQHILRSIIDMIELYRAATDQEVFAFADHDRLFIANVPAFVAITNQTSRKLIHAVIQNGTLDNYTPAEIQTAAQSTALNVDIQNGKIVMPADHHGIKTLLQFLNESRYSGPLSHHPYVTNSQRPA
jgi:hypothetical protein